MVVHFSACKQGAAHPGSTSECPLLRQKHHTHRLWYIDCGTPVNVQWKLTQNRINCWIKSLFLYVLHTNIFLVASENYGWTTDITILTMSLLWNLWTMNPSFKYRGWAVNVTWQKHISTSRTLPPQSNSKTATTTLTCCKDENSSGVFF